MLPPPPPPRLWAYSTCSHFHHPHHPQLDQTYHYLHSQFHSSPTSATIIIIFINSINKKILSIIKGILPSSLLPLATLPPYNSNITTPTTTTMTTITIAISILTIIRIIKNSIFIVCIITLSDQQTMVSEFNSRWVSHTSSFLPQLNQC